MEEKEILKLYKRHLTGVSCVKLAKELKIHPNKIRRAFEKHNLKIHSFCRAETTIVYDNFFQNINSEIKAYLLGFIAADGSVWKNSQANSYTLQINVCETDLYIIELIKTYINPTAKILKIKGRKNGNYVGKDQVCIKIVSTKIFNDLGLLGITPKKTYSEIECLNKIPKYLRIHFVRGYFDGDGSITISKDPKQWKRYNVSLNIISKNSLILSLIMKELNCGAILRYSNVADCFTLTSSYSKVVKEMYNKMYTNANFFFKRKRNKFRKILII